jgi:hypothetical protein
MLLFLQNSLPNSVGVTLYGHPGGSNTHFLTKITTDIGTCIIQIISQFGAFDEKIATKHI